MKKILTLLLGIILLTGCTKENDVAVNSQNKGKTSILITGNITNEQAAAQITAEFGPYTENVYIQNTTGLTTVDLSAFSSLVNLFITENSNLATINLNSLTTIYDTFIIKDNNALKTLSFPALTRTPSSIEEQFIIENNPILTSISFPALVNIFGEFEINNNDFLTSISFPVLVNTSGYFEIDRNDSLTSVLFPVLKTAYYLGIDYNSKLTSIGITSLSSCSDGLSFGYNALPSSQINTILNKLLNVTITDENNYPYISLRGQIPPAPPTGQGLIDKQTLIDRVGNILQTD